MPPGVIRHEAGSSLLLFEATLFSAYVNHPRGTPFTLLVPCSVQGVSPVFGSDLVDPVADEQEEFVDLTARQSVV